MYTIKLSTATYCAYYLRGIICILIRIIDTPSYVTRILTYRTPSSINLDKTVSLFYHDNSRAKVPTCVCAIKSSFFSKLPFKSKVLLINPII